MNVPNVHPESNLWKEPNVAQKGKVAFLAPAIAVVMKSGDELRLYVPLAGTVFGEVAALSGTSPGGELN